MATQLDSTEVGIICLTRDNLSSQWIHFEAGALAKGRDGLVCTFLLDVQPTDVKPPLSDFQATTYDRDEVFRLLASINARVEGAGERALDEERLKKLFEKFWPDLNEALQSIVQEKQHTRAPERKQADILDEILVTVRRIASSLESSETLSGSGGALEQVRLSQLKMRELLSAVRDGELIAENKAERLATSVATAYRHQDLIRSLANKPEFANLSPEDLAVRIASELHMSPKSVRLYLDRIGGRGGKAE